MINWRGRSIVSPPRQYDLYTWVEREELWEIAVSNRK